MSSSDTSDEEKTQRLREALDTQFIQANMFNPKSSSHWSEKLELTKQRSLRFNEKEEFETLGASPQFQQYVAKQLSIKLEKKLEKIMGGVADSHALYNPHTKGGIKLFTASKKTIKKVAENVKAKKRKKPVKDYSSESDNEVKCREVAVKPEDILNKKEVKHWSARSKAKVFKYRQSNNNELVEIV